MTTPLMPYSIIFKPSPNGWTAIPEGSTTLPMGVVVLKFTWSGLEGIRYRLGRTVGGVSSYTDLVPVIDPVSVRTPRSSATVQITVGVETWLQVQGSTTFGSVQEGDPERVGVTVIPLGTQAA